MNFRRQIPDVGTSSSAQNPPDDSDDEDPLLSRVALSCVHQLSTILSDPDDAKFIESIAITDEPAQAFLSSAAAYTSVSSYLTSFTSSGAGDDPFCFWLHRTFRSINSDLRLMATSFIPLLAGIYFSHVHSPSDPVAGFEAVLLCIYSSETRSRAGNSIAVSIRDISHPSLYHSLSAKQKSKRAISQTTIAVISPPLEPQTAIKSTKRATIVGVALDYYHKHISQMPDWTKLDFCRFVADWAGQDCACRCDFDPNPSSCEMEIEGSVNIVKEMKKLEIKKGESSNKGVRRTRIPLPLELLQPLLRILGHCLLGRMNKEDEVRDAASMAVRCLYARCYHDLVPQGILASRSLIQLDKRAREAASMAGAAAMPWKPRKRKGKKPASSIK